MSDLYLNFNKNSKHRRNHRGGRSKKPFVIIIVLLLVIAAAAGGIYLGLRRKAQKGRGSQKTCFGEADSDCHISGRIFH